MKDPKTLFPVLFASSWLGNLLLTILAFYLAFSHQGPLSPAIFLTVAACILSGNALPIIVYTILIRWRGFELRAESAEAGVRVRDALLRSEEVMARLDEAEGSLSKSILVARQVPERIREGFESIQQLADKMEALELAPFTEAMQKQKDSGSLLKGSIEDLTRAVKLVEADLATVGKDVRKVPGALAGMVEQLQKPAPKEVTGDGEVPVGERLDMLFESLESVQDSLDGLLQRIAELQVAGVAQPDAPVALEETETTAPDGPVTEEAPEPDSEDVPDLETEEPPVEPESDGGQEGESSESVPAEPETKPAQEKEAELKLEDGEAFVLSDGQTRLIAHAMIGMRNKLYIRGDEPWLSWEDGQQMELIGIGEFAWAIADLKEPIEVTVLINDEYACKEGTVTLEPGKTATLNPTFPSE